MFRQRYCFSIFTGTGTVHKSGACIPCFADILSAPSEAEKPKTGVCFCRGRAVWDCFVFYAGKYGTEHDLCIKRWHHRCMCPVLCSRYGRILFKNEKSGLWFYIGFVIAIAGVILISLNGQKTLNLNPFGDGLAFLAMISWGAYSALVKKSGNGSIR